jgi:hypothetical protein
MEEQSWTLRYNPERKEIIERLRIKLRKAGREVHTIHGVVTNATLFDAALAALEKELDQEITVKRGK